MQYIKFIYYTLTFIISIIIMMMMMMIIIHCVFIYFSSLYFIVLWTPHELCL